MVGRRHRPWLGISGATLLVAMFLPAVHECDTTAYPYELPMLWLPYALGAAFALVGLARTQTAFRRAAWAVRGVLLLYGLASTAAMLVVGGVGLLPTTVSIMLIAVNGVTCEPDERRVAVTAIFAGGMQCIWFAPWCLDQGALIGVYLALAGSVGLMVGGALWANDLPSAPIPPPTHVELPPARLLRS